MEGPDRGRGCDDLSDAAHSGRINVGMWSNLLVGLLMSMPALMYGTLLWLRS